MGDAQAHRVAVLFVDVNPRRRAEQAVKGANQRKDEFLAILAHELRNPRAPIKNCLQIARLASKPDTTLQRTVDMMVRQLNHLVRLVDDLLDVGRIESGKVTLRREPLSLNDVLSRSIEANHTLLDARQHELVVDAGNEQLFVYADVDRLSQVFSNLLSNAAKYTDRGGRITVVMRRDGKDAVVQVIDTGVGIPENDLPHVFDLFSQVRMHQGRAEGGLGIGLSLVKHFVGMHDGQISAHSEGPGSGSTFTVRVPLMNRPHDTAGVRCGEQLRPIPPRMMRVLVVDDNVDAADSLAIILRLEGHQVSVAHSGMEALEQVEDTRPNVVLLDIGMPDLDGLETARRLRASIRKRTDPCGTHGMGPRQRSPANARRRVRSPLGEASGSRHTMLDVAAPLKSNIDTRDGSVRH